MKKEDLYEGVFVTYWGRNNEWKLYRQSDGMIVGYKSSFNDELPDAEAQTSVRRIMTNTTNENDFGRFIQRHAPRVARYDPKKDEAQTFIPVPGVDK